MSIEEMLLAAGLLGLAAVLAMWVRARDEPRTPFDRAHLYEHAETFAAALVAGGLAAWLLGYEPATPEGFIAILAVAGTGFAFIKGLVARKE